MDIEINSILVNIYYFLVTAISVRETPTSLLTTAESASQSLSNRAHYITGYFF